MMLRHFVATQNLLGALLKPAANFRQSIRWTAIATQEKDLSCNDATLRAAKPFKDIPSETEFPLIGTGWVFLPIIGKYDHKQFAKVLLEKRKKMGDIYREKFGLFNIVVTFNADDMQTMFAHEGPYPLRMDIETLRSYRESRKQWYTALGLMLVNGKEWLDLRKRIQKYMMKPRAVLGFLNPMQDVARDLVEKISRERDENKEMPDLLTELNKWSLESVSLVGLDSRLGCLETNLAPDSDGMKMIKSIQTAFDCMNKLEPLTGNFPFWKFLPSPTFKRFSEALDTFTEIAFKHINQSIAKLKNSADGDQDLTLLQSMILKGGLDVSAAMVMVGDMMMAGIETTSHTVGILLNNLAKYPAKQEILYQHLKEVLPRKEDRITPEIFNELRYLKSCMKESQRLDPIVSAIARTFDHDVVMSGYRIPTGTILLVGGQGIYRDEKYFTNPNEFLPERWLNKNEKFHPFAYLPFGFGTRSCIGRRLAELEIMCLTAELIRNFKVEYHHEEIGFYTRMVNVPDKPLRFTFIDR